MLVLSRKLKEKIVLPTVGAAIQVLDIKHGSVRLGIEAPPDVTVLREEVQARMNEWRGAQPSPAEFSRAAVSAQLLTRLKTTGAGLGLLRLQLEAGSTTDARATVAALQHDLQFLLHGLDGETNPAAKPASTKPARPAHKRALLVEDDLNERELLAFLLRRSGLDVDTAGDGADALDYLRCHDRPDVILLDMGLPRVDGPTMVRELRRNPAYRGLKIFGVSGHAPEEFNIEPGPAGVDRWFRKPFDPSVLLRDLTEELDGCPCGA